MDAATWAYVERARRLSKRLAVRYVGPGDVAAATSGVGDLLPLDADAPTSGRQPGSRLVKTALKRVLAWYMSYLAEQVNELGRTLVALGEALAAHIDGPGAGPELGARLTQLERRVERLEGAGGEEASDGG
ncbi:MAG: hypothetical protein ACRDZX_17675 [Acidimicrobiales bacterium]